jgi:hypothetical protein
MVETESQVPTPGTWGTLNKIGHPEGWPILLITDL